MEGLVTEKVDLISGITLFRVYFYLRGSRLRRLH